MKLVCYIIAAVAFCKQRLIYFVGYRLLNA